MKQLKPWFAITAGFHRVPQSEHQYPTDAIKTAQRSAVVKLKLELLAWRGVGARTRALLRVHRGMLPGRKGLLRLILLRALALSPLSHLAIRDLLLAIWQSQIPDFLGT